MPTTKFYIVGVACFIVALAFSSSLKKHFDKTGRFDDALLFGVLFGLMWIGVMLGLFIS